MFACGIHLQLTKPRNARLKHTFNFNACTLLGCRKHYFLENTTEMAISSCSTQLQYDIAARKRLNEDFKNAYLNFFNTK